MTKRLETMPVEPLQQAFKDSGLTLSDLATNLGWLKSTGSRRGQPRRGGDTSRVARALGLLEKPKGGNGNQPYVAAVIDVDKAVLLVRAMGLAPVDFKEWGL